jgi:hypothetical protein
MIVVCLALAVAFGFFLFRPARILGVQRAALTCSVGCSARLCQRRADGDWRCFRVNGSGDEIPYRVSIDGSGCWDASRLEPDPEGSPRRLSGCLSILDYLFG